MKLSLETIGEGIKMRELSIDLRQFPSKNANLIKRKPAIGILNPLLKSADYKQRWRPLALGISGGAENQHIKANLLSRCAVNCINSFV
jgi:hypothetical protein